MPLRFGAQPPMAACSYPLRYYTQLFLGHKEYTHEGRGRPFWRNEILGRGSDRSSNEERESPQRCRNPVKPRNRAPCCTRTHLRKNGTSIGCHGLRGLSV